MRDKDMVFLLLSIKISKWVSYDGWYATRDILDIAKALILKMWIRVDTRKFTASSVMITNGAKILRTPDNTIFSRNLPSFLIM